MRIDHAQFHFIYQILTVIILLTLIYMSTCPNHSSYWFDVDNNEYTKKKRNKKTFYEYVAAAQSGAVRGLLFGTVLGGEGMVSGIRNAAIYGMLNPVMYHFGF